MLFRSLGVVALIAVVALVVRGEVGGRMLAVALVAGLAVALLAPAVWSLWAVHHHEDAAYASAGPPLTGRGRSGTGGTFGLPSGPQTGLTAGELAWLRGQHQHERWLVAVPSDLTAADAIIAGDAILPMGGFYGTDPAMTREGLADLVSRGELRFVDVGGFTLGDPNQIKQLVTQVCTRVDPTAWHAPAGTLYDCAGHQDAIRTTKLTPAAPTGAAGAAPGGYKLGPAAAVAKLVACLSAHGWSPTAAGSNPTTPAATKALAACASLIHAAVPSAPAP